MNPHLIYLLLLVPLVVLIVQDFRMRRVGILWLIILAVFSLGISLIVFPAMEVVRNIVLNVLLLLYMGLGITVYLRLRTRRWVNPLKSHIGSGDVVFLLAVTPLFDLRSYLVFMLVSFTISLVWMAAVKLRSGIKTIPLVATAGIGLCFSTFLRIFL